MTPFSRTIRTSGTGSGAPVVELIAGALKGFKLYEIGIYIVNATASTFALGRPAAIGVGPTTPVPLVSPMAPTAPSSAATLAVAWGTTAPTIPAAFFREISLPATAGAGLTPPWKFDSGIFVPAGASIILWTLTTVSIADVYFNITE